MSNKKRDQKKLLTPEMIERYERLIIKAGNLTDLYETTKLHITTVRRILGKGMAKESQIAILEQYCNEVETINL